MIQKKEIIINNQRISYNIKHTNDKSPIMFFLHGWGSNKESFNYFFNKYNNCISLDFPSSGKSEKLKKVYNLEDYVDIVNTLYDKLVINQKNCIIVTHSFGGRVLLKWISKINFKFSSLVFIGVPFFRQLSFFQKLQITSVKYLDKKPLSFIKPFFQSIYCKLFKNSDYSNIKREIDKKTFQNIVNTDISIYLELLKNKQVTFIWGENDKEAPLYNIVKAKKILPKAKLHVIKNASHFPWIDQPNNFPIIN